MSPAPEPADLVAEVVMACPAVAALADDGLLATFLPGRRVAGVRIEDDVCEVAVILRLDGSPLPEVAEQVRHAVTPVVGGRRVDIVIADVVLPDSDVVLPVLPATEPARADMGGR